MHGIAGGGNSHGSRSDRHQADRQPLHIGNYVGAIKPAVTASTNPNVHSYYFIADYHAIGGDADTRCALDARDRGELARGGPRPRAKSCLYRQSDVPEILELTWILHSVTAKGLMNRAHAYKAAVAENDATPGRDPDQASHGICIRIPC